MTLNFNVDQQFLCGIQRLSTTLGYEIGEGITVTAQQGDRIGVSLKDGNAVIYYRKKVQFFRGIGILMERARLSDSFEVFEDVFLRI